MQHDHDFLLEKRLRTLEPDLHCRYTSAIFAMQHTLSHYQQRFQEFTDHSLLHSMSVVNYCNALIGPEQVEMLNADEIYVLLMGCYLHDIGMSVSEKDLECFKQKLDCASYLAKHPDASSETLVREYHHELSALFIRKYAALLEIQTEEHLFCIAQIARGHRRTDLFDPVEFPAAYPLPNGNTVCLPYLGALVRLADEMDVAADRHLQPLYDIERLKIEQKIYFSRLIEAVLRMHIQPEGFTMDVKTDDEKIYEGLLSVREKIQETLDLCKAVIMERTAYQLPQAWVKLRRI
ncbi:MAG: hypothetical protein E7329_08860 [Clostridiales bacterium]|nr:hypothetical protein [Clostridiales bacterium]